MRFSTAPALLDSGLFAGHSVRRARLTSCFHVSMLPQHRIAPVVSTGSKPCPEHPPSASIKSRIQHCSSIHRSGTAGADEFLFCDSALVRILKPLFSSSQVTFGGRSHKPPSAVPRSELLFCESTTVEKSYQVTLQFSGHSVAVWQSSPVGWLTRRFEMGLLSIKTFWAVTSVKLSLFACFYSKRNCFLIACGQRQLGGWRAFTGLQHPRTATIYGPVIGPARKQPFNPVRRSSMLLNHGAAAEPSAIANRCVAQRTLVESEGL